MCVCLWAPQRDWLLNGWAKTGGGGIARSHSLGQGPCTRRVLPPACGSTWWTVAKEGVMSLHDAVVPPSGPCGRACRASRGQWAWAHVPPLESHWLPGTGFLGAPDAKHTVLRHRGGQHGGLGATAPALHHKGIGAARDCGEPVSGALGLFPPSWGGTSIRGTASGGRDGNILANGQKSGRGGSFSRARPSVPLPVSRVATSRWS